MHVCNKHQSTFRMDYMKVESRRKDGMSPTATHLKHAGPYKVTKRAQKLGKMVEETVAEACSSESPQVARSLCIAVQDVAMLQATLPSTAHGPAASGKCPTQKRRISMLVH